MQQFFGIFIIIMHDVFAVPFGGGRTSPFMEHRINITEIVAGNNGGDKIIFVAIIGNIQIR